MDWIKRLNSAIKYMEENITGNIEFEELSKICLCSTYHFQRMFSYMTNITLSEYIRRRKMTLAAVDLQSTNDKVIDIALKYGYLSPTAFTRAFKSVHGIAPSLVRKSDVILKSYMPLNFQITIKGVEEMNYRIEEKEEFRILGVSVPLEKNMEKNFEKIPKLWNKLANNGTISKLAGIMNNNPKALLGVNVCNSDDDWKYFVAVSSSNADSGFEEFIVPKSTWAIFEGEGTGVSIQELMQKAYVEWLPNSGYEYAKTPDLEVYYDPNPKNTKYEVWIPVIKK